jgi:putative FmdB family regulatory protein
MPIYEYKCPDCGKRFEKFATISKAKADNIACPKCGKQNAVRVMSSFSRGGCGSGSGISSGSGAGFTT